LGFVGGVLSSCSGYGVSVVDGLKDGCVKEAEA
jgi:hypothetical protein